MDSRIFALVCLVVIVYHIVKIFDHLHELKQLRAERKPKPKPDKDGE